MFMRVPIRKKEQKGETNSEKSALIQEKNTHTEKTNEMEESQFFNMGFSFEQLILSNN